MDLLLFHNRLSAASGQFRVYAKRQRRRTITYGFANNNFKNDVETGYIFPPYFSG